MRNFYKVVSVCSLSYNRRKSVLTGLLLSLFLLFSSSLFAQEKHTVTGKVLDEKQEPLVGATVALKGSSSVGTITDLDGKFSLSVSGEKQTLVISFLGMATQEIDVLGQNDIKVTLKDNNQNVGEIIVVGYGTQKKADLSSAIATLTPSDRLKSPGGVTAGLQSEVAGVQLTGDKIRIRGVGSINNTDPLYVVDGMIGGAMPDDSNIESIQVLKDAASCAIYGSRGANGVIMVTSKRGHAGGVKVEYDGFAGLKKLAHNVSLLNGQQLAELVNEEMYNAKPTRTDYLAALSNPASIGAGYNMADALLQTGSYQKHNLSLSGGNENATFRLNATYNSDKSIIIKDQNKNYSLQFISDFKKGNLKIGETVKINSYIRDWSNKNIIDAQKWSSTMPLYDPNSTTGFGGAGNGTDVESALANAYLNTHNQESSSVNGNVWASYEFITGLKYKFNMGVDIWKDRTQEYIPDYVVGQYQKHTPDALNLTSAQNTRYLYENTLSYDKSFGKHSFSALVGLTSEESKYKSMSAGVRSLPSSELQILNLTQDASSKNVGSGLGQTAMYSLLGRLNYSYDSKYMLTFNFRRDGSGVFGSTNRYGNFPSMSAAWRVSQEGFMKDFSLISDLKLRGSYGVLGNSDIAAYQYQSTVSFDNIWYYFNDTKVTGALPMTPSNPDVKWESQYSADFGLDLSLFKDKLSFTFDYYDKRTEDMLVNVPISYTAGYLDAFPTLNSGSISNKGLELSATYKNLEGKFNYSVSGNISTVKNKVISLGANNEILAGNISPVGENITRTAVDHSIGQFWGYVADGLYKTQAQLDADKSFAPNAQLGDVRFKDITGDGKLDAKDKAFIGNPIPKFSYGFNLEASYNFDFGKIDASMVWQGSYGNDIYNNSRYWGEGMYHYYNSFATTLDRYRADELVFTNPVSGVKTVYPKNTDTDMPRAVLGDPNHNLRASSRFIEDGSYLRLKTLTIGYTAPKSFSDKMKIDRLRFYIGGKNLLTFTKYSGYDPEVASENGLSNGRYNLNRGIDAVSPWGQTYTNAREIFLGIQCSF